MKGVELLAYSPLAFGTLSGKYLNGARPEGARCTLFERFSRYFNPQGIAATQAYIDIANRHGLDPAKMALAFVNQRPFVASNIIGATNLEQLEANIDSIDLTLGSEILADLEEAGDHLLQPLSVGIAITTSFSNNIKSQKIKKPSQTGGLIVLSQR